MSRDWQVVAVGGIDERGVVGARGPRADFAPGDLAAALRWQAVSAAPYPDFRRLDPASKALAMAAEAVDWSVLPAAVRERTALLLGTAHGCLHTDLKFAASLAGPALAAGLFAFTLPSTPLGVVALRHGLGGPTLALSLPVDRQHEVLGCAADLFASGAAAACCCCLGDWLPGAGAPPGAGPGRTKFVALLLAEGESGAPACLPAGLLSAPDAAARILDHLRRERPRG